MKTAAVSISYSQVWYIFPFRLKAEHFTASRNLSLIHIDSEEEYWTYYQGGSSSGNIYIPKGVWGTIYKFDEAQNLVLQASGADEMAAAGKAAANIMNQNMNVSDSSITYLSLIHI